MPDRNPAWDGTSLAVDHLRDDHAKLDRTVQQLSDAEIRSGTIGTGTAFVDIQFPAALNGSPAVASINTVDATALYIRSAVWQGAGVLRVTVNANTTGDIVVSASVNAVTTT